MGQARVRANTSLASDIIHWEADGILTCREPTVHLSDSVLLVGSLRLALVGVFIPEDSTTLPT